MLKEKVAHSSSNFVGLLETARRALRKARRNRHSISGSGYYARAYHDAISQLAGLGEAISVRLDASEQSERAGMLRQALATLLKERHSFDRADSQLSDLRAMWYAHLRPSIGVVSEGRCYLVPELRESLPRSLRSIFDQAQACFSSGLWDAGLVMLRKLIESLIIVGYERRNKEDEIRTHGNFIPFGDLIGKAKSGELFRLSRDSKSAIDEVKRLGDNAAHNPRFSARTSDVEALRVGVRILIEEITKNIEQFEMAQIKDRVKTDTRLQVAS